mmetsp:Transcript_37621/g.62292  ORF Transcript_37621/g.62292 Transcript_37621/m.62292 type:complete len:109 (-) Transcript_37621:574-900(-)
MIVNSTEAPEPASFLEAKWRPHFNFRDRELSIDDDDWLLRLFEAEVHRTFALIWHFPGQSPLLLVTVFLGRLETSQALPNARVVRNEHVAGRSTTLPPAQAERVPSRS